MTDVDKVLVPKPALILGYSGLIPFIVLSVALWLTTETYLPDVENALLLYAAIILSFMGAIHWGVAMARSDNPDAKVLMLSVIPALLAWFASFIGGVVQWSIIYVAFAGLCVLDSVSTRQGNMPAWYPRLRVPLTLVVILCLINAQLALVLA